MAEEDEIDIEGDFDFKNSNDSETSNIYDLNEPPSKTANLQPEFSQHPWVLEQGWSLDQVTDEKSKAVIGKMLLEEQQYIGGKLRGKQTSAVGKPKTKSIAVSRKFWSDEEKQLFLKGFLNWGRRWARIADLIPGRSVQQVKNYGQQYLKSLERRKVDESGADCSLPDSLESSIALITTAQPTVRARNKRASKSLLVSTSEVVRIRAAEAASDEDVDVEDDQSADAADDEVYHSLMAAAGITADDTAEKSAELSPAADTTAAETQDDAIKEEELEKPEPAINSEDSIDANGSSDEDSEHENEYWIVTSNGDMKFFPNPKEERVLNKEEITEEEKSIHSEFFDCRSSNKNPDRYMKIRNHILDSWMKSRPNYLNKTVVRVGLRNCGDVNCIGRIHAYLEQIGAINFACDQCQYNRPCKVSKEKVRRKSSSEAMPLRLNNIAPRKRRVRDIDGTWVDERDLEGKTIEHGKVVKDGKVKKIKTRHARDPFRLVPCQNFTNEKPKPFDVVIEASVLVLMDVHAHQCKTEVIGMLGGQYLEEQGRLQVTMAQPCDSLSTHVQCEMDPVSQAQSCMHIMSQGCSVVGWYHSHPTFTPDPSIRDIETQAKYQAWFAQGGSPFIGVIVSPYNSLRLNPSLHSQVRCLTISKSAENETGEPFKFEYEVSQQHWNSESLLEEIRTILEKYESYPNRVNLLNRYRSNNNVTCLQKLLESVSHVVPLVEDERETFMAHVSSLVEVFYSENNNDESSPICAPGFEQAAPETDMVVEQEVETIVPSDDDKLVKKSDSDVT